MNRPEMALALVGIALAVLCFVALVKSEKPLLFQWAATAALVVWGIFAGHRGSEGLAYSMIFIGVVWFFAQPLQETIARMRAMERGEFKWWKVGKSNPNR